MHFRLSWIIWKDRIRGYPVSIDAHCSWYPDVLRFLRPFLSFALQHCLTRSSALSVIHHCFGRMTRGTDCVQLECCTRTRCPSRSPCLGQWGLESSFPDLIETHSCRLQMWHWTQKWEVALCSLLWSTASEVACQPRGCGPRIYRRCGTPGHPPVTTPADGRSGCSRSSSLFSHRSRTKSPAVRVCAGTRFCRCQNGTLMQTSVVRYHCHFSFPYWSCQAPSWSLRCTCPPQRKITHQHLTNVRWLPILCHRSKLVPFGYNKYMTMIYKCHCTVAFCAVVVVLFGHELRWFSDELGELCRPAQSTQGIPSLWPGTWSSTQPH